MFKYSYGLIYLLFLLKYIHEFRANVHAHGYEGMTYLFSSFPIVHYWFKSTEVPFFIVLNGIVEDPHKLVGPQTICVICTLFNDAAVD